MNEGVREEERNVAGGWVMHIFSQTCSNFNRLLNRCKNSTASKKPCWMMTSQVCCWLQGEAFQSSEDDSIVESSGEKSTQTTGPLCFDKAIECSPVMGFHNRTVRSCEQEARILPLGEKATSFTLSLWCDKT